MSAQQGRDTVVVAASAGGVEALRLLLARLPADLPAAVLVVLHVSATGGTMLAKVLGRAGALPVTEAADGEEMRPGHVYVAPADRHMLVGDGKIQLSKGPRYNGLRPAADPLFLSAALHAPTRTVAVVLSGTLDDGAAGCAAIERRGGAVVVQDPAESAYDGMPRSALAATRHAQVLRLADIAAYLTRQTGPAPADPPPPDRELAERISVLLDPARPQSWGAEGWAGVTCPECAGPLRQEDATTPMRFVCQVGHVWSPESLVTAHAEGVERALWSAVLHLEERARLSQMLADHADSGGRVASARGLRARGRASSAAAGRIRALLGSAGMSQPDHSENEPPQPG